MNMSRRGFFSFVVRSLALLSLAPTAMLKAPQESVAAAPPQDTVEPAAGQPHLLTQCGEQAIPIQTFGVLRLRCAAPVRAGDFLAVNANGEVLPLGYGLEPNSFFGIALNSMHEPGGITAVHVWG